MSKSYTSVVPITSQDNDSDTDKSSDEAVLKNNAAAQILNKRSNDSFRSKRSKSGYVRPHSVNPSQKKGWGSIQKKTETLMRKSHDVNSKRKSLSDRKKQPVTDRRNRITAQIDEIRAEQAERLHQKELQKQISRSMISNPSRYIFHMTVHPKNTYKQIWDLFIIVLVIFSAIYIPMTLAFPNMQGINYWLQSTFDFLFLIDFAMCFRTGYIRPDNEVEMDQTKIVQMYLGSWFTIDLAASFPLDYILVLFETDGSSKQIKNILKLFKLPRLLRLGRLLKFLARFKYAGAVKILKFVFLLILVAHWTGCFFFFIMQIEDEWGHSTWLEHNVGHINRDGDAIISKYLTLLYTGFLMLIGEGMDMETDAEKFYGSLVVLVGTIVTAVIVGNVSFVVSNQNSTQSQYQNKIDMVTDEMRALHLPGELQDRTLAYYDYLWNRHRTFDPANIRFTADLSPTLRKEILLHMNRDCVLNCDFFRDVSNDCIIRLVHAFKFSVYLAHDILADEGEISSDLVFIIHGSAKVTKRGRVMPVSLLSPGDYFGEKSLLMHHRNAVSVVATENCDTRVLEKEDFEILSFTFPELKESILKRSAHMDVTEYDKHTKRNTVARGKMGGLTPQQQAVLNEISQSTMNIEEIKSMALESSREPIVIPSSNAKGNDEKKVREKRMIEIFSTISEMNEQNQKRDKQLNELNLKMSKLLEIVSNGNGGGGGRML